MEQSDKILGSSPSNGDRPSKSVNRPQAAAMASTQNMSPPPALKCPRCDSTNTKFCYYNNYSQAQPRHFCKSCRRYWTQGGTLRNVPVGGGCRKNKRVRHRSLISPIGSALIDGPTPFSDSTNGVLGRLNTLSGLGHCGGGSGAHQYLSGETGSQVLNIAFARFQESIRRHESGDSPLSDAMSLPPLAHKPCGLTNCSGGGACGIGQTSLHLDSVAAGQMGHPFDNGIRFEQLHGEGSFCNYGFDMTSNPLAYAVHNSKLHNHQIGCTSATATLASIEDELSNFSNLQYTVDNISGDAPPHADQKGYEDLSSAATSGTFHRLMTSSAPLHLLGQRDPMQLSHGDDSLHVNKTDLSRKYVAEDREREKAAIGMSGVDGLSLMMPVDNWQQPASSAMEMLYEPHQSMMWGSGSGRWQDMHPMGSSTAAAAGSVL
ncbi:hypothetical protein KP509_11G043000 [Ceratopteris richardii]|nr:hypothetical protein KP509_11G043000 [Ceratopteris richardii]